VRTVDFHCLHLGIVDDPLIDLEARPSEGRAKNSIHRVEPQIGWRTTREVQLEDMMRVRR